jgi:hypothetical protein
MKEGLATDGVNGYLLLPHMPFRVDEPLFAQQITEQIIAPFGVVLRVLEDELC